MPMSGTASIGAFSSAGLITLLYLERNVSTPRVHNYITCNVFSFYARIFPIHFNASLKQNTMQLI